MDPTPRRLAIRKYPNRRFYDTTRSRHVTLSELHDSVCAGQELAITDSATGQDITNVVLTQILIERDAGKLTLIPSQILHQIVRTQAGMLGSVFESFMRHMIQTQKSSQEQWSRFLQNTLGITLSPAANPFDWARGMADAFQPQTVRSEQPSSAPASPHEASEVDTLRRQLDELTRRVEELSTAQAPALPRRKSGARGSRRTQS